MEKIRNGHDRARILGKLCFLAATPVMAFYIAQLIYGGYPWDYAPLTVAGNAVCIGAVYYILSALTGRIALCSVLVCLLAAIVGTANYYVDTFRGNPILPWDFKALETAMAVSGNYHYHFTWQILFVAALLFLAAGVFYRKKIYGRVRLWSAWFRLTLLAIGLCCMAPILHPEILDAMGITSDVWDQGRSYKEKGVVGAFLSNLLFMDVDVPEGYSKEAWQELVDTGKKGEGGTGGAAAVSEEEARPHVIAIMNESWADFESFGNLELNKSVMEYMNSLDAIRGSAYASVFGAGTSASEFEFLTGHSMAFLPSGSIPYQQYVLGSTESLASILKENGYTCLAHHPGERSSWNRDQAYPLLGFDAFKCADEMNVELTMEHGYVSDRSSFEQIIYELEHKEPGEKLFLFNVTIQNHGSYEDADFVSDVYVEGAKGKYPLAEQYLTLVDKTDDAFRMLVEYLEDFDEPVILLMFGDHQPALEEDFLDLAYGVKQEDMTMGQYLDKFKVPYIIWANYDLGEDEGKDTSLNFLAQELLKYAGIPAGDYGDYLNGFRETVPVVSFAGYKDARGNAYSHLEDTVFTQDIHNYQIVQYGILFDRQK